MNIRNPWLRVTLSLLVSGALLYLLTLSIDWQATFATITAIRWRYVPLLALFWTLPLACRTLLGQALMQWRIRFMPTFHCLNISFLMNNTLPLRVGDVTRAVLVARTEDDVSGWAVLASIVIERILDILSVITILAIVLIFLPVGQQVVISGVILGAVSLVGLATLLVIARYPAPVLRLLDTILARVPPLQRLGLRAKAASVIEGVQAMTTVGGVRDVLLWTTLTWGLSLVGSWLLLLVLPDLAAVPNIFAGIALGLVLISLASVIPLTFGNIGAFEGAVVLAFTTIGVTREAAFAFALLWHVAVFMTYAVWGTFSLVIGQFSLADFQQADDAQRAYSSGETSSSQ